MPDDLKAVVARVSEYAARLESAPIGRGGSKDDLMERSSDLRTLLSALRQRDEALAHAREAFLNLRADAKTWTVDIDGDETGVSATVTLVSDHHQVSELCDALGMTGPYDEWFDDRITRYVEMPAKALSGSETNAR